MTSNDVLGGNVDLMEFAGKLLSTALWLTT